MVAKDKQDGAGHPKSIKTLAREYYEQMLPEFGEIDEATRSILYSYALTCCQVDDLNKRISKEGLLVQGERGIMENPAVGTLHKLNADKARYYTPLKRVLDKKGTMSESERFERDDAFMGF